MRIVDLNPHKYWQIVDEKEDRVVDGRFETEEEVNETLQELEEAYPELEFTAVPPPNTQVGQDVWGALGKTETTLMHLTGFGNYYHTDKDLLSEDLILGTLMLGTEDLIIRIIDKRWPLRVTQIDEQQKVYLNRGTWLIRNAGERAGIPGNKIGKVGEKEYVPPPSFFIIREPGVPTRDPNTGRVIGQTEGKELARIKVERSNVKEEQSIADIIDGNVTQDLLQGVIEPLTFDRLKEDARSLTRKRSILRFYMQWKYQMRLTPGHFLDLPKKWDNADAVYIKKKQFKAPNS
jgi:hypothetical protein